MRSPSFRCRAALCAVRRGPGGSQWVSALPTQVQAPQSEAVAPGAARYCAPCSCGCGRQRGQGSLRCLSLCLRCVASATASGTGHCPARTPPNAVPWVCPEKDTFLSGQLLVVGRRPSGSNWANEISRDEVPRARCERSAERRLREVGGGAAGGGYFWSCARYSCGAHARGFRKRSILRLWFMTEGCVWPRRKPVGVGTAERRQQVEPGTARPVPLQTRSRGCVLRRIRSCQASSWGSEGDGVVSTGRTRLVEMKCLERGVGEAPKGACGRQAGVRREAGTSGLVPVTLAGHMPEFSANGASGASPSGGESATPIINPQSILRIRRPWLLQSMAAKGRR